jgi:hypothetical protein
MQVYTENGLSVESGERKDLGELKPKPPQHK